MTDCCCCCFVVVTQCSGPGVTTSQSNEGPITNNLGTQSGPDSGEWQAEVVFELVWALPRVAPQNISQTFIMTQVNITHECQEAWGNAEARELVMINRTLFKSWIIKQGRKEKRRGTFCSRRETGLGSFNFKITSFFGRKCLEFH